MKPKKIVSLVLALATVVSMFVIPGTAVTSSDFTQEELQCNNYDIRKYTDPMWEGNIVYNEIVHPIRNQNGTLPDFQLMYNASEIVSVKDYKLNVTYKEGVDYRLVNGNLQIIPSGSIPVMNYTDMHPTSVPSDYGADEFMPYYPRKDSGWEYWTGGSDVCSKSLAVTYIHNDTWGGPVPASQESKLPKTFNKLKNDEALKIVVIGDSVASGAMGSAFLGIPPSVESYPEMMFRALKAKYTNSNISLVNSAQGGAMTLTYSDNQSFMNEKIINHSPDLLIVNFGMNDSSCDRVGISSAEFREDTLNLVNYVKQKLPNCEIMFLSSLYGNRYTFPASSYEAHANVYKTLANELGTGYAFANPQEIEKYLIEQVGKDYICFTADNMVHPGDFGMRLSAQAILEALSFNNISTYTDHIMSKLTAYANVSSRPASKQQELNDYLATTAARLSAMDEEWDVSEAADAAYAEIDAILSRCTTHSYVDTIIAPTCKEQGYTHSVCSVCGYSYDHSFTDAAGGEHIMDSGRQTIAPTYKLPGEITYSCALCDYTETAAVPVLANPPAVSGQGMIHINNDHNYMAANSIKPYSGGSGYVELDFCPINIERFDGVPYVGLWINNYSTTACYNFLTQEVQIIKTSLPFGGGTVYASAPYSWTSNGGKYASNWHKFGVSVKGTTVSIYIDGELILQSTNSNYSSSGEVALLYSNGECYIDNIKVMKGSYDPSTGTGGAQLGFWDFNDTASFNNFKSNWGQQYGDMSQVTPNKATITTGCYKHTCSGSAVATLPAGCTEGGNTQYACNSCAANYFGNTTNALYGTHNLIDRTVTLEPTESSTGLCTYRCSTCTLTFKQVLPAVYNSSNHGHEHTMDGGRQTVAPTYKLPGEMVYTCAECGYTETVEIPVLTNPPTITNEGMLHISNSNNYMQTQTIYPYSSGSGFVEMDFCPLNIESFASGTPHVGVRWQNGYGMIACYNFAAQEVQIANIGLPFSGTPTVYASAPYSWTSNGGKYEYNWHKFAVGIKGSTVSIYIDGELILQSTNSAFASGNEYALVYSNGQCYMDNMRVLSGSYNPAAGTGGTVLGSWDFNSTASFNSFTTEWIQAASTMTKQNPTEANVTTGSYVHTCSGSAVATIPATCLSGGYTQYTCDMCGETYNGSFTNALSSNGQHTLTNRTVTVEPTESAPGECTYDCSVCGIKFTQTIHLENTDNADAEAFVAEVNAIGNVTLEDETAVAAAYVTYGALSENAKSFDSVISAKATLDSANARIPVLKAAKAKADAYASAVAQISDAVTLSDKTAIEAAEAKYAEISGDSDVMSFVSASDVSAMQSARTAYNTIVVRNFISDADAEAADVSVANKADIAALIEYYGNTVTGLYNNVNGNTLKQQAMNSHSKLLTAQNRIAALEEAIAAASLVNRVGATSLVISDSLAVNYKVKVDSAYEILRVTFTLGGESTVIDAADATIDTQGRYVFRFDEIAPNLVDDTITSVVTVRNADGLELDCKPERYSITTYVNRKISTDDSVLKSLLASLVNFSDAAAAYQDDAALPSSSVENWNTYKNAIAPIREYTSIQEFGNEFASPAVQWSGITPTLDDAIDLMISISGDIGENYRASAVYNGKTYYYDILNDGTKNYFVFSNYSFAQMSSKFVFTILDEQGNAVSNSLTFNVESYVANTIGYADAKLASLLTALMQYGDASRGHGSANS